MAGDLPDIDSLPPTEYLALEVLAARHRLGERMWTFPNRPRVVAALHALARRRLIDVQGGVAPKTVQAWLTEAGRSAVLSDSYEPPISSEVARVRADVVEEILADLKPEINWQHKHYGAGTDKVGMGRLIGMQDAYRTVAKHRAAPAESVVGAPTPAARHPEDDCHRCGRSLAIPWAAPSPLWNAVMRSGSINGEELFDGIVCPTCFAQLAQERGIAEVWHFDAARVLVPLETVTPSGRVWDEQAWLWREPAGAPTPISSPSDVAAPRDALTDQDFADFNETIADRDCSTLDSACHSVWLHGKWRWLTSQMTTEEKEAFADAVDRAGDVLADGETRLPVDRWWREPALPEDEGTRQEGLINVDD